MRDLYDLYVMAQNNCFDGATLVSSVKATFERRETSIPTDTPIAFTTMFTDDADKNMQWRAFLRRSKLENEALALAKVIELLRVFLLPLLTAAAVEDKFNKSWPAGGPWA